MSSKPSNSATKKESKSEGVSSSYSKLQMGLKSIDSKPKKSNVKKKPKTPYVKKSLPVAPVVKKPSREPSPFNPHLPDRSMSDYYCKICDSHMNSSQMWDSHVQGKRHERSVAKQLSERSKRKPNQVKKKKILSVSPAIQKQLDEICDPIIGLKYVCEIIKLAPNLGPCYKCFLCSSSLATGEILIDHLYGSKHKLAYVKENDPEGYKLIEGLGLTKAALDNIADEHAIRLEALHGRGTMQVELEKPTPVERYKKRNDSPPRKRKAQSLYSDEDDDYTYPGGQKSRPYGGHSPVTERRADNNRDLRSPPKDDYRYDRHSPLRDELMERELYLKEQYGPEPLYQSSTDDNILKLKQDISYMRSKLEDEHYRKERDEFLRERDRCSSYERRISSPPRSNADDVLRKEQLRFVQNSQTDRKYPDGEPSIQRRSRSPMQRRSRSPIPIRKTVVDYSQENPARSAYPGSDPQPRAQSVHELYNRPVIDNEPVFKTAEPTKSPTLLDFINVLLKLPSSLRLQLIEKLLPIEPQNEEDCNKINSIGNAMVTAAMKFKVMNLQPEQQKQLTEMCGLQISRNSESSMSGIPGIGDGEYRWDQQLNVRQSASPDRDLSSQLFKAQPQQTNVASFLESWNTATRDTNASNRNYVNYPS